MLKFQTVQRNSFISRMDFRTKMLLAIMVSIIALLWDSPGAQFCLALVIVGASLFAGVKWKYVQTILVIMAPFYIFLLATHMFFNREMVMTLKGFSTPDQLSRMLTLPTGWPVIGGQFATWEGFLFGVNIIFKTLTLTLVISLAAFTTDVDNMIVSMVKAKIPYKIAFIFSSTLRFFPLLVEEFGSIIEAQRLRGLAIEKMNLVQRIRVYARVGVPLILSAMVKSQQLEIVLQAKAFSGSADRTYLHESTLTRLDYAAIILLTIFFVAALFLYVQFQIGKFGGPL